MSGKRITLLSFGPWQQVAWATPGVRCVHRVAFSKREELSVMRMGYVSAAASFWR